MYDKICECGTKFSASNIRQVKCKKNCSRKTQNKSRHKKLFAEINFLGVDGEGVDRPDGAHDYVMLSVGDATLVHDDGSQLEYWEIFEFLYSQFKANKYAAFIGFYLKYDFIQWTKTLPEDRAFQLWDKNAQARRKPKTRKNPDPFPVIVDGWEIDILAGRRFRLRPHVCKKKLFKEQCAGCNRAFTDMDAVERSTSAPDSIMDSEITDVTDVNAFWAELKKEIKTSQANPWMYISDTGGFWQTSFLTAIKPDSWPTPICTVEEYETIKRGKETREKLVPYGDVSAYEEMRQYNILENDILARATRVLCTGFNSIGVKIAGREWYGPGRAAQIWLTGISKGLGESGFDAKTINERVPEYVLEAGRKCYYGGWFEQFIHGHIPGIVFEYDINSAYPHIISTLPCLLHGTWRQSESPSSEYGLGMVGTGEIGMYHVTVRGTNNYIGAMPYRSRQGRILRPRHVTGWYWGHELDASINAGLIDTVRLHEYAVYSPCDCPPPLRGIADLYQHRLSVGKNSPQGRADKLAYNSAYGKVAQSIGTPKFGNSVYASLITAGCRTAILDAIATHPDGPRAVAMVATDGVYFTSEHPSLHMSPTTLGAWDVQLKKNMTQFMPGVYWDDKTRENLNRKEAPKLKSRGINAKDLARSIGQLDADFSRFEDDVRTGNAVSWPKFKMTTSFEIVSCSQALQRKKWATAGQVTKGKPRTIDSDPFRKRDATPYLDNGYIRTDPYDSVEPMESVPYSRHFGMELAENMLMGESVVPDGDNGDFLAWILGGSIE